MASVNGIHGGPMAGKLAPTDAMRGCHLLNASMDAAPTEAEPDRRRGPHPSLPWRIVERHADTVGRQVRAPRWPGIPRDTEPGTQAWAP